MDTIFSKILVKITKSESNEVIIRIQLQNFHFSFEKCTQSEAPRLLSGRGWAKQNREICHYTMQQSFASMEAKHMQNAW